MARDLIDVLDEMHPDVAKAFRASITLMENDVRVALIESALARQAVSEAVELLDFDQAYYAPLREAMAAAYAAGGSFALDEIRAAGRTRGIAGAAIGHFDGSNPRAEEWLRARTSSLISEIREDQRAAVRQALNASWTRGDSPRTTALDLVGRTNRLTGRREGGILGLTERMSGWADAAADELRSSSARVREGYFRRELRDRRFDSLIRRHIREGTEIPEEDIRKIAGRMRSRILKYRGNMIARTETLTALNSSYFEGLEQQIGQGHVDRNLTILTWDAANDLATRPHHASMDGQERRPGEPFVSGLGGLLMHPGDVSHGASGADRINCRCRLVTRIDFVQQFLDRQAASG